MEINKNSILSAGAIDILKKRRYFNPDLNESSWCDVADRVAGAIADAETTLELKNKYGEIFFNMIYETKFIPSTPCLTNANKDKPGQLSSCFILAIDDNIESIYDTDRDCAKIFQKNGGAGFNLSALRPQDTVVETSKGYSCGPIGFMEIYDHTADVVTRNNPRKGALKGDLNDWHPDVLKFIHCKDDKQKFKRINISVSISDKFMNAVINNQPWQLKFPDFSWNKDIYNNEWHGDIDDWESKGYPVKIYKEVFARELYHEMMESAWRTGDPGVSFRDTMDRDNPNPHMGKIFATNPCAEFSSIAYNSCNLGSINLALMGKTREEVFSNLAIYVPLAVRFLDNMITVNHLPLEKIEKVTKAVRSVGLGVMGFADMLYNLGIKYNSEESYKFTDDLFAYIYGKAKEASIALAIEKGVYDAWEGSIWQQLGIRIRNSNFLSIAPTGTISFIAGVSGGLEPNFGLVFTRTTNEGYTYNILCPVFERVLKERGIDVELVLKKVIDNKGSCQGIPEVPKDIQNVFVTAMDITPAEHVRMTGVIQKHVDLSCSKTVNLPHGATVQDVMDTYMLAWQQGIKGITIYRDGSKDDQPLVVGKKEEKVIKVNPEGYVDVEPAMEEAYGKRIKVKTGCGHLWLFFFVDGKHNLAEIWSQVSGGGCKANIESMSRLASLCFRSNVDPKHILDQLSSAFCKTSMDNTGSKSCGQVIAKEIRKFLDSGKTIIEIEKNKVDSIMKLIENFNCDTKISQEEAKAIKDLGITKIEVAPTQEVDNPNICYDGKPHQFDGQGCQSCVKCGFNKCGE